MINISLFLIIDLEFESYGELTPKVRYPGDNKLSKCQKEIKIDN